jgi:pimeloyl-ACP methyl ester carboxylesterase
VDTANHLDLKDSNITFWDEGGGEPILLVHASFSADWLAPLAGLLPGYRVVRTHRAGYGESLDKSGQLTLIDHTRHLAEVLRAQGIERAHVVGHSSGASIALQLASTYPQLVQTMVLLETAFPYAPDEPKSNAMRLAIGAAKEDKLDEAFDHFIGSVCSPGYRQVFVRTLGEAGLAAAVQSSRYFFDHEIHALAGWDSDAARLEAIEQPVLLVDGAEGEALDSPYRARNRALAQRLQRAERVSLPGVSHAMPIENPSLVAQTVLNFVRQHPLEG